MESVPCFKAFVVERDIAYDGEPSEGHPGVFVGLGPPNSSPEVAYTGCGLCMAMALLEAIYPSREQALEAVKSDPRRHS